MNHKISRSITSLAGLILALSSIVILVNHFIYKFPGNNYFPPNVLLIALILILFNLGLKLCFNKNSKPSQIGQELLYFFGVMSIIGFATNAVQLTPFPTIDHYIVSLENHLHVPLQDMLIWTNKHTKLYHLLTVVYDSLQYQMTFLPLIIIATGRIYLLREYYFLILCTLVLGFIFYYFFPTTAPASVIHSDLFTRDQIATGLKFNQIHHYIDPTTIEGGLIAFPSFHTIWAILCVYLIREWVIACVLLSIINFILIASCVLLGWHYVSDVIGGLVVFLISYYFLLCCQNK